MKRLGRWLLLVALGVLGGVLLVTLVVLLNERGRWISNPWNYAAVLTLLQTGFLLVHFRPSLRSPRFHLALLSLLAVHCTVYGLLLAAIPEWRFPWSAAILFGGTFIMTSLLSGWHFETASDVRELRRLTAHVSAPGAGEIVRRFVELLERVADGRIDAGEALRRLEGPEWEDPVLWELELMADAYHLLQHFHSDADIRARDPGHCRSLAEELRWYAAQLRAVLESAG